LKPLDVKKIGLKETLQYQPKIVGKGSDDDWFEILRKLFSFFLLKWKIDPVE